MKTVLLAIAVIKKDQRILVRQFDPAKNPYKEPWGLLGGDSKETARSPKCSTANCVSGGT